MSTTQPPVQVRTQGRSGRSSGGTAKLVVVGLILLIVLIFVLQNTGVVTFHYLFWEFGLALWVMFVATLVVGVLLGLLGGAILRRRQRHEPRRRVTRD